MIPPEAVWIFGAVAAEFSPTGKRGYQVLWQSAGLHQSASAELIEVSACYDFAAARRHQFFRLKDGRFAVGYSRTVAAASDSSNRESVLTCVQLYSSEAISRPAFDPFLIGQQISADLSFDRLQSLFGRPGATIDIEKAWTIDEKNSPRTCPAPESAAVWQLFEMALGTEGPGPRPTLLLGDPEAQEKALRLAFDAIPLDCRGSLSFSTQMDGCSIPTGRFHVLGCRKPPRGNKAVIYLENAGSDQPVTAAGKRLARIPSIRSRQEVESCWYADRSMEGQPRLRPSDLDFAAVASYFRANRNELAAALEGQLPGWIPRMVRGPLITDLVGEIDAAKARRILELLTSPHLLTTAEVTSWNDRHQCVGKLQLRIRCFLANARGLGRGPGASISISDKEPT